MPNSNKRGFIRLIILLVVGVLILSYFRVDLRQLWDSDVTQGNFGAIWSFLQNAWYSYIKTPVIYILNLILGLIQ